MYGSENKKRLKRSDRKMMNVALAAAVASDSGRAAVAVKFGEVVAIAFDKKNHHAELAVLQNVFEGVKLYIASVN